MFHSCSTHQNPGLYILLYSVYVLEEKHFYMHFDMYSNFHLRFINKLLTYLLTYIEMNVLSGEAVLAIDKSCLQGMIIFQSFVCWMLFTFTVVPINSKDH